MKKNEEEYKLSTTSPQVLRMPQNFKSFYSGGPNSSNENQIFVIIYFLK